MKETNIYTGGKNPNPRNSYNGKIRYQKWEQEKKWWMENLSWNIIQDYIELNSTKVITLKTDYKLLSDEYDELFKKYDELKYVVEQDEPYLLKNN